MVSFGMVLPVQNVRPDRIHMVYWEKHIFQPVVRSVVPVIMLNRKVQRIVLPVRIRQHPPSVQHRLAIVYVPTAIMMTAPAMVWFIVFHHARPVLSGRERNVNYVRLVHILDGQDPLHVILVGMGKFLKKVLPSVRVAQPVGQRLRLG